jgi:hypothetical protein
MRPGFWTSLILLIPGVRRAFDIAAEKSLEAARFQGEILAMRSRIDTLETERADMSREKDAAYKLVINVFSQYAWGTKQFAEASGMPPQFHPQGGAMPADSINASALIERGNKQAMEDFLREMDNRGYQEAGST